MNAVTHHVHDNPYYKRASRDSWIRRVTEQCRKEELCSICHFCQPLSSQSINLLLLGSTSLDNHKHCQFFLISLSLYISFHIQDVLLSSTTKTLTVPTTKKIPLTFGSWHRLEPSKCDGVYWIQINARVASLFLYIWLLFTIFPRMGGQCDSVLLVQSAPKTTLHIF